MFRFIKLILLFLIFGTCLILLTCDKGHTVTRDECINAANSTFLQKSCCLNLDLDDDAAKTCIKAKKPYFKTESVNLIKYSILVECIYEKRKYIKSDSQLNIRSIKAEAKRLYRNDSVQKNFMVNMYRVCGRNATITYDKLKNSPRGKDFIQQASKPYFFLVFACVGKYSLNNCPYFRWKGENETSTEICTDNANQCKMLFFKNKVNFNGKFPK